MPSKKEGHIVLYPEYFDKALTRAEGRRVPRAVAVSKPDTKQIANAARKLGFQHKVEEKAAFSPRWFERRGRVLILSRKRSKGDGKAHSKQDIIGLIGKRLKDREERVKER